MPVSAPQELPGYRYGPTYRVPLRRLAQAAYYILRGENRNLGADFTMLAPSMPAPAIYECLDAVPQSGPFVIVGNHYERPGLWMAWSALVAGRAVYERTGQPVHWIAITEWENYRLYGVPIPSAVTRFIFTRFHDTFGFVGMAPESATPSERANSMRRALGVVRDGGIIGIFPEGTVGPTPEMLPARPGSGAFLNTLAGVKHPIVPVGIFERDARLTVRFGEPFHLVIDKRAMRAEQDQATRTRVMSAVAALVPPILRGPYAADPDTADRDAINPPTDSPRQPS